MKSVDDNDNCNNGARKETKHNSRITDGHSVNNLLFEIAIYLYTCRKIDNEQRRIKQGQIHEPTIDDKWWPEHFPLAINNDVDFCNANNLDDDTFNVWLLPHNSTPNTSTGSDVGEITFDCLTIKPACLYAQSTDVCNDIACWYVGDTIDRSSI